MRRTALISVSLLVVLLTGCSQVQDAATGAASQLAAAATDEVMRQICPPLQDGQISAQEQRLLSDVLATAKSAGVSTSITDPLTQVAKAAGQVPTGSITVLQKACGPSGSSRVPDKE